MPAILGHLTALGQPAASLIGRADRAARAALALAGDAPGPLGRVLLWSGPWGWAVQPLLAGPALPLTGDGGVLGVAAGLWLLAVGAMQLMWAWHSARRQAVG